MSNPQTITASVFSNLPCTVLAVTTESLDCLIADAKYKQHPYGKVWQRFDTVAFAELVSNVQSRGLDQEIILYQEMVLEGWHRYLACLQTKTEPRFVEFKGTDLQAAEKVHASGVRRQSSADQRYAAFTMLGDACPEFQAKYERLKKQGIEQKNTGTALSTDAQRVDVLGSKANAAGVSRGTAAKIEKVKKRNPEAVAEIAKGKTTANKELKKFKEAKPLAENSNAPTSKVVLNVYTVTLVAPIREMLEDCRLKATAAKTAKGTSFVCDATWESQQAILKSLANLLKTNSVDVNITLD